MVLIMNNNNNAKKISYYKFQFYRGKVLHNYQPWNGSTKVGACKEIEKAILGC